MRFTRLNLVKFGMFTETELDLLPEGVNVILGANEAGKTTTMAAVQQLLYGIPLRSQHSYLHSNADLRIGAILRANDGADVEVYRIKRNTGSLRSTADIPIADETMVELLGGVGADVYASLFSISHEEIVSGGQALLKSEGELGRALFAAGTGLTQLNSVMAKLDARAGELFKSGASKPLINEGLVRYRESIAAMKEHSQSSSAVEQLDRILEGANERLVELDLNYQELSIAFTRATRVRSTRAQMERRRLHKQELEGIDLGGPRVAPDIAADLVAAQGVRRDGLSSLATLEPDLQSLDEKLGDIGVDELLLSQSKEIERLIEELGGIRQNLKDLPSLNKQVGDLERQLEGLFRRVPKDCRMDANGMPAVTDVERSRVERLGEAWVRIDDALVASRLSRDEVKSTLSRNKADLDALPEANDVSNLRAAAARIRAEGQLELTLGNLQQQIAGLLAKLDATINSLGLTTSAREADKLAGPSVARVNEVDQRVVETKAGVTAALGEDERIKAELNDVEGQLSGLLQLIDPPSIEDLDRARTHRDDGWKLVRGAWLENVSLDAQVDAWSDGQTLDRAYEAAVGMADEIADRLRREAEAVERRANLEGQTAVKIGLIEENTRLIEERRGEHAAAVDMWCKLWEPLGVEAGSRAEMDEFLARARDMAADSVALRDLDGKAAVLSATIGRCADDLRGLLREASDKPEDSLSLVALLERSELLCTTSDAAREQRLLAVQALESSRVLMGKHEGTLAAAESALESWELEWSDSVTPLGIPVSTTPTDVAVLLSTLKEIEDKSVELDEKRRRVSGMERRNSDVDDQLAAVLALLPHFKIDTTATEIAINALQKLLKSAQSAAATRTTLQEQRENKVLDVERTRGLVANAIAKIAILIGEACAVDEQSLMAAIEQTNRATTLASEIERLETDLIDATGVSLDQLGGEGDAFVGIDLDTEIRELSSRLEDRDRDRKEVALEIGGLRTDRASIDDSDEAAMDAESAQLVLSEVANNSDEYVRVVLARYLLEQQIAEYRSQNQGPILRRASEIFSQLTLEEYSGIDTDIDDKGQLVILAVRDSAGPLDVAALSTGARDQLYLSLRFAALEHYAIGTRNLPLLLDDLFVHFDDARTRAGLLVLAQLCSRMQVLLFTHHERVAEQAMDAISSDKLQVQVLAH